MGGRGGGGYVETEGGGRHTWSVWDTGLPYLTEEINVKPAKPDAPPGYHTQTVGIMKTRLSKASYQRLVASLPHHPSTTSHMVAKSPSPPLRPKKKCFSSEGSAGLGDVALSLYHIYLAVKLLSARH